MSDEQRRTKFSHTTNFLRNRPQLEELASTVVPRVWPEAEDLRALICGGSVGCEAYSLLIALREFGGGRRAEVLSIDVAEDITAQGRAGRFPLVNFAPLYAMEGGMPEEMRLRWFSVEEDGAFWRPLPELRAAAEFQTLDLLTQPLLREFDLVICQNVLIHLHPPSATALLDHLLARARRRAVFVCSGVDLEMKARIAAAGFQTWTGRLEEIHDAYASHRMHYRKHPGKHYFELEDIDRTRPDWAARYSTLFYRE